MNEPTTEELIENAKTKMSFSRFDPYRGKIRCSVLRLCDRLEQQAEEIKQLRDRAMETLDNVDATYEENEHLTTENAKLTEEINRLTKKTQEQVDTIVNLVKEQK